MALYLNPLDALHGDLGVVAADDVCMLLSNSGETAELLELIPHLETTGTARIALVGRAESSLALGSDVVLEASVDREVCPLNLAPTASTAVAMAIGDALAAVWMEREGFLRRLRNQPSRWIARKTAHHDGGRPYGAAAELPFLTGRHPCQM